MIFKGTLTSKFFQFSLVKFGDPDMTPYKQHLGILPNFFPNSPITMYDGCPQLQLFLQKNFLK